MPRNRSAKLAVLGAAVPRSRPVSFSSRSSTALRRRIVAGVLVLLSLVLITIYFRESANGGLHRAQNTGATVLRPFEIAADRIARPFTDVYGYFAGLVSAKSENEKLRRQVEQYKQRWIDAAGAKQENEQLRPLISYLASPKFPKDYRSRSVVADVIGQPSSDFDQQVTISAGRSAGIRYQDPVVTADGLVGRVTKVSRNQAQVTLLTDESSAVSVVDLNTNARGIVQHGSDPSTALVVDRVTTDKRVEQGDLMVTSGWRSGNLESIYPKGIPVGTVQSVGQVDTDLFKHIQLRPFVDFSSLNSVLVLIPNQPRSRLP
ncbi:MAG: rod shape-determining protein MreC [Actinomycetota bacterium]|nr:rod shape-determining protein MreC [Actinomycetota bacterium]